MTDSAHTGRMPAVPSNVAEAVCKRWPDRGPQWLNNVHDELAALCQRYDAEPVQVMSARYGFVVAVSTPNGPLIVRSSPDPDGGNQAAVSIALADLGVSPKLHELIETDTGTWTVADRVLPGTPIGDAPNRANPVLIADMLRPMLGQPAPTPAMPSLAAWLRDRLTDPHLDDLPIGRSAAPEDERRRALDTLDGLSANDTAELCHGDASPLNLLAGNNNRLWLVDPRGMSGEVSYDAAVIALKAARYVPPTLGASKLAELVGVDPERVVGWLRVADAARV